MAPQRDAKGRFKKKAEATDNEYVSRRVRIDGQLVEYDDATVPVRVKRNAADILMARPGDDGQCMNTNCIMRTQRNEKAFPHPVYAVSTQKTVIYIVDKVSLAKNGSGVKYLHAVRYNISQRETDIIKVHDTYGSGELGWLTLRVPSDPKGSPRRKSGAGQRFAGTSGPKDRTYTGKSNRNITSYSRFAVAVGALNFPEDTVS